MTQNRRQFLKNAATIATVISVPALPGCSEEEEMAGPEINQEWENRADELEAVTWTVDNPGMFPPDVHLPVSTYDAGARSVTVTVPHVMEADHWITTIYIRDQDGIVLGLQEYDAPSSPAESPSIEFPLHSSTTEVVAYAYCNLHDNWAEEALTTG